jgi:hypothetical protein
MKQHDLLTQEESHNALKATKNISENGEKKTAIT